MSMKRTFSLPGTDKSKRNTDDWFTPALRGFLSWKQWERRRGGTEVIIFSLVPQWRSSNRKSTQARTPTRAYTYPPFVSLFTSNASTQTVGRAKQWAANAVVGFIFWKMEKHGWYVGRTSGRFQPPFPYLRPPLFPVSFLAIHHRIFLLF